MNPFAADVLVGRQTGAEPKEHLGSLNGLSGPGTRMRKGGSTPIIRPRVTDFLGLSVPQSEVDFAIPRLHEDLPLCVDPFLLWSSKSELYQQLHARVLAFFGKLRLLVLSGHRPQAARLLLSCEEAVELGLGYAQGTKRGSAVGAGLASQVLDLFTGVPQLHEKDLNHIEAIQLLVPGIAEDRVSDLTASILKQFFIDFTVERAARYGLPRRDFALANVLDLDLLEWKGRVVASLPFNPSSGAPILLAPLDLLRRLPWINYDDFYKSHYAPLVLPPDAARRRVQKEAVLAHNRVNYETVQAYVLAKEQLADQCRPTPLFEPTNLGALQRRLRGLANIEPGTAGAKAYEDLCVALLPSLLHPELWYAASQARTIEGAHIRDLMFYNDGVTPFFRDLRDRLGARQVVFELKNVKALESEHVNQLYRYLDAEVGYFGVLVSRNPPSAAVRRNIVDLHSSKRATVLCLDDSDLNLMVSAAAASRRPAEVLLKKHTEFVRLLPK